MPMHHDHIPGHTPHDPKAKHEPEHPHASKHHGKKSGSEDVAIEEGLQAIYGDDRSDLHVVERDGSRLTRILTRVVLALALIAVLAFGGFFLYTTFFDQGTANKPLVMSIEAPAEVKSGEKTQIVINYSNPSGTPLASLELDINLPSSFVLATAQPQPTDTEELIWTIGSLGSHSDGQIILEGVWLSSVPATTNVQALAAYRPGNFNSNFSDIATATVTTLSSVLTLELEGPETGTPGQELSYTAKVKNTGLEEMKAAQFALTLPTGFVLTSSTPSLEAGADPEWQLGDLIPEAEVEVTWKGSFTADVKDVQQFAAVVSVPEDDRQLPQASTQWFTDIAGSDLQTTMVVNGNTDGATTELGGTLRLTVRLENAGDSDINGASFIIDFKPDSGIPIIWSSAALAGGKLTAAGIAFDSAVVGTVKAGEKKTYNLSFPIKDTLAATEVDEWTATTYVTVGDTKVQTPPFPISMKASADLSASARFYSETGAPIGEGPLPPEVGEATTYRVFWKIEEAVHELEDVTVSATIPPDVTWDNRVLSSTGNVQFDSTTQTVRWEISSLPANEEATAEFTVRLIPGEEDAGTFVKLLSGTVLSATDAETDTAVEAEAESFTTEIPEDTFAAGKGTVVD
jgi:uncharacterized repeat protein (TIGR01451 family)